MVAVGYMDPGNWATDIEGGSRFGYRLLWVLLMSNAMAVLLQTLSARLGLATGRDLAQACRDSYGTLIRWALFILCEIAIAACDLAEVLGTAIGLNLLTGMFFEHPLPLIWGVMLTGFDSLLLLMIQRWGMRRMEHFIIMLVSLIGGCFIIEVFLSKPAWGDIPAGFIPRLDSIDALYIAVGILGATVMPHNLYLHSSLVQTRAVRKNPQSIAQACKYNFLDSLIALNGAFFVNAAILVVAAAAFGSRGIEVNGIQDAHKLLNNVLGTKLAPLVFAIALIAAGQSSTLTGTMAGQITMEGFLQIRIRPWLRRLITRSLAIIPAVLVIAYQGDAGSESLLIFSQVILSMQLPFAVVPLVRFTSSRVKMGQFANNWMVWILAWLIAIVIIGLNVFLVAGEVRQWMHDWPQNRLLIFWVSAVISGALLALLVYLTFKPDRIRPDQRLSVERIVRAAVNHPLGFNKIGVALEAKAIDAAPLAEAIAMARAHKAQLLLLHVVEGVGGQWHGPDAADAEQRADEKYLHDLAVMLNDDLRDDGLPAVMPVLGYGVVPKELIRMVQEQKLDMLVVGGHGHHRVADVFHGETIDAVRHGVTIPVLSVRGKEL